MKYPIAGLEALIDIVDLGSFSKAAEKQHISQTGLTRRMQRLEEQLGLRLLDRTTRSVTLTSVGRDFLPEARRLIEEVERSFLRLRHRAQRLDGDVVIASVPSLMFGRLPQVLGDYMHQCPHTRIEVLDRNSTRVLDAVRHRQAEFGLHVHLPEHLPDLHHEPLAAAPFSAVCRADHALADRTRLEWADLGGHDLITLGGSSGNRQRMESQLTRSGIDIRTRFVVEYYSTALGLAAQGLGVAILVDLGVAPSPPLVRHPCRGL
ncbi:MAG: LysR family transcriptional regulator [Paucibacter sp.]|nr:LysR family transcriptional regulator [Roseateles sp.]